MTNPREDAWHIRHVGIYCDRCGTEESGDIRADTREQAFDGMRAHLNSKGWSCDTGGDLCPSCDAETRPND